MSRRLRAARVTIGASLALAGLAFAAMPAQGAFHLMKVREVFPGTTASNETAFIELQMFDAGQNFVMGHDIDYYNETGGVQGSYTFPSNAMNGENQRTILLGDLAAGGNPDFVDVNLGDAIQPIAGGGAVCFPDADPPDCVSWGNFTGNAILPAPGAGTPVSPAGIPNGSSITRSMAPNCSTLLENADDTNDSATDFEVTPPTPRGNAFAPTEQACAPGGGGGGGGGPNTTIDKKPKDKVKKRKVSYGFSSPTPGVIFQCSENGNPFHACTSPHAFKAKKGKNNFEVRAIDAAGNADQTPAEDQFKFKKKK